MALADLWAKPFLFLKMKVKMNL